ncbi:MAG: thiamine pyrophosphate-dependent enzyme [Prolixibacteraceae bacterium]|jgi:indolepyruvate ferredoxin oxidoreductase alpha subunit|nr:thiamine pyrophosphate-dependent enzyme [Prolixibacteraceae bacterium]
MLKKLLLGAEAIGQGAIDGGISGVYAYPGTPSTEITEYIQENETAIERNLHQQWSANEKTAMEAALGMSYAGKRTLVCMKHVGLNVAADVFMNIAVTGINGGMVVAVADDPSMHSSQNEQDSRYYGKFAMVPVMEPTNQQEAYDMTIAALELSEKTGVPVMIRITTRLAHSRSGVVLAPMARMENPLSLPSDPMQFVLLPANARKRYNILLAQHPGFLKYSEEASWNRFEEGPDRSLGVICCGIAYNYFRENYPDISPYPSVKVSQYPLPVKLLKQLESQVDEILVLEEGYPLVEEQLKGFFERGKRVIGRLDGTLPRAGELNPDLVALALKIERSAGQTPPDLLVNRPPALCKGCGHHDTYRALNEVMEEYGKGKVFSDIGCYTLGALPPYNSIYSCVDMGASVTMAKGAADAGLFPSVAVVGDSTFTHSGITGLLDAVNEKSNMVLIIGDNESISMTGGQDSSAFGHIESICLGVGVDPNHIHVLESLPKNHELLVKLLREEIDYNGVSVIIPRRECIQKLARQKKN